MIGSQKNHASALGIVLTWVLCVGSSVGCGNSQNVIHPDGGDVGSIGSCTLCSSDGKTYDDSCGVDYQGNSYVCIPDAISDVDAGPQCSSGECAPTCSVGFTDCSYEDSCLDRKLAYGSVKVCVQTR